MAQYPIPAHLSPQATAMWGSQYSTGARQGLATSQLVQQAIRQAQALQARQAELEMRARQFEQQQELREKEALRKEQELEIQAAYKETLLGMRERQLENQARQEARKINDAANRSAAMLRIQQQNADTQRMRATALSAPKQQSEISDYTSPTGRKFVRVLNPNTGGISLHPEETGAGPTMTKRTEFPAVPATEGTPGKPTLYWPSWLGGKQYRAGTPPVPATPGREAYTETERRRLPAQPGAANAAQALPRFRWANGKLEPVTANGKVDEAEEAVDESEIEEEELPVGDEEE